MIFLFEQHTYDERFLKGILSEEFFERNTKSFAVKANGGYRLDCVGFYYCNGNSVFILPRVFVKADGEKQKWAIERNLKIQSDFDNFFIKQDHPDRNSSSKSEERVRFLDDLSEWLFSAMSFYRSKKNSKSVQDVVSPRVKEFREGNDPTLNDVVRQMRQFYQDNWELFAFVYKNKHSGNGKINWQKTISKKQPFLQNGIPIYIDPIVKAKVFDLDERLIVLYFSAMNYVQQKFNFNMPKSDFYNPLKPAEIERMMDGRGLRELRNIKHKYFADKFLQLYNIMFGFFRWAGTFYANGCATDYLLTNKFNNVFEDMINDLIGEELPEEMKLMKSQKDGRRVDHIYEKEGLIFARKNNNENIYFIGDSKYYRSDRLINVHDLAKQFDYAKNIVQYNIFNSFSKSKDQKYNDNKKGLFYRDELTEGYNVTPNFFIRGSAYSCEDECDDDNTSRPAGALYSFDDCDLYKVSNTLPFKVDRSAEDDENEIVDPDEKGKTLWEMRNRHFPNRLFDRDTLLLQVYNVNFLHVLKLYTSRDMAARKRFKSYAHEAFKTNFLKLLDEKYTFFAVYPKPNVWLSGEKMSLENGQSEELLRLEKFVNDNFKLLHGKMIRRNENEKFVILALEKGCNENSLILKRLENTASLIWLSVENFVDNEYESSKNTLDVMDADGEWSESLNGFMMNHKSFMEKICSSNTVLPKWIKIVSNKPGAGTYLLNGGIIPDYDASNDEVKGYLLPCIR